MWKEGKEVETGHGKMLFHHRHHPPHWKMSVKHLIYQTERVRERMKHTPPGDWSIFEKIDHKYKTEDGNTSRRHAKGKMSHTDQSDEVEPEQIHERIGGIRWQMKRGSFLSGERSLSAFCVTPPYHSPVCF